MYKGDTIGCVYAVHPLNSECFHLRFLHHFIKGPTSFDDLRTVDRHLCGTFKDACSKQKILDTDDQDDNALETYLCHSPHKLQHLFTIMLVFCNLTDTHPLWNKYEDSMCHDILLQTCQITSSVDTPTIPAIYNGGLLLLEDLVIAIGSQRLDAYSLNTPDRNEDVCPNCLILRETSYNIHKLKQYIADNETLQNFDQADVYNFVFRNIYIHTDRNILDAFGGTGETFLLNLLLAKLWHNGDLAIAIFSSGIALTLLNNRRTAHATFNLPINVAHQENSTCHIMHSSDEVTILKKRKHIVWDEATMSHKCSLQALDTTMRDHRSNNNILGGATLLLAGDFLQTLLIYTQRTPADELNACLKKFLLWSHVQLKQLTINLRSLLQTDQPTAQFSEMLLKIGNGQITYDDNGYIDTTTIGHTVSSLHDLCSAIYPNLTTEYIKPDWLCNRAVHALTNAAVDTLNYNLVSYLLKNVVTDQLTPLPTSIRLHTFQ
uniref:ATP-dependent DNA helicase n=1 Tax=Octopus bimaculoides TaxID=37653 RepID=A0A0L8I5L2_OCTBM|eukprot:XP_014790591.1 PREDICTED: uncharacterized protein LOC106883951 [Octopus bimaculoides]